MISVRAKYGDAETVIQESIRSDTIFAVSMYVFTYTMHYYMVYSGYILAITGFT